MTAVAEMLARKWSVMVCPLPLVPELMRKIKESKSAILQRCIVRMGKIQLIETEEERNKTDKEKIMRKDDIQSEHITGTSQERKSEVGGRERAIEVGRTMQKRWAE